MPSITACHAGKDQKEPGKLQETWVYKGSRVISDHPIWDTNVFGKITFIFPLIKISINTAPICLFGKYGCRCTRILSINAFQHMQQVKDPFYWHNTRMTKYHQKLLWFWPKIYMWIQMKNQATSNSSQCHPTIWTYFFIPLHMHLSLLYWL